MSLTELPFGDMMTNFWEIKDVFRTLEGKLEWYEFMEKVDEKVSKLNSLCDYETAAKIVADEMKMNETVKIKDMIPDKEQVEDACEISCQYSGTRTCGQCIHGSLYSPKKSEIDQESPFGAI